MSVEDLNTRLNPRNYRTFEASATIGNGVFDTLKLIIKLVLTKAKTAGSSRSKTTAVSKPAEPETVEAAQPEASRTPVEASAGTVASEREVPEEPLPVVAAIPEASAPTTPTPESVSATAPPPAALVEPASSGDQYRPYPGDQGSGSASKKISHSRFAPAPTPESEGENIEKNVIETGATVSPGDLTSPSMAPSLRRKGSGKKRGFFKRLFGIK